MKVHYRQPGPGQKEPGRPPDELWITPYLVDEGGNPIHFLAVGPAYAEFSAATVEAINKGYVPKNAHVELVLERDRDGRMVYGMVNHTMN